jgi:hypothetical protein
MDRMPLLQSDDVSVPKSSSGGNTHSTRHFILANNRTLVPFQLPLQLMQTVTKGFSMIEPAFVNRTRYACITFELSLSNAPVHSQPTYAYKDLLKCRR